MIYSSKENTVEEIDEFLSGLVKDLKAFNDKKETNNVMKTLRLIEIVIDDSEKKC